MKLIITEEQYNELTKVDNVYDGLDTYSRRRINFINIKNSIDKRIGYRTRNVLKNDPRGLAGHVQTIIHNVVWETIPIEWGGSDDDKLPIYSSEMYNRINNEYSRYIIEELKKILEDEDNNN